MSGITLAYGRCSCIMPDEKHIITKALEESMSNREKDIKRTKEEIKIGKLEQDKNNIQTMIARVCYTPECQ